MVTNKWEQLRSRKAIRVLHVIEGQQLKGQQLKDVCDDMLEDRYYLAKRYPTILLNANNIWASDPLKDRTWCFWLHTLLVVRYLIDGYEEFGERSYLQKAMKLFQDWQKHSVAKSLPEMAWHDHATALRLLVICKLFEVWKTNEWEEEIVHDFARIAEAHCEKLADPSFYKEQHNHGMDQDIALFTACTVFSQMSESESWSQKALQRFQQQMSHLFAADGSYREHSPGYAVIFVNRLYNFMDFLRDTGIPQYKDLQNVIEKQLVYLTNIIQPDGRVPNIGDSQMAPFRMGNWSGLNETIIENLRYVASGGSNGIPPSNLDAIYPDGGFAMMRNKWKYVNDTVQLVLTSGFHSRTHKHNDDLSVTLFGHGQPLLVDAGLYNYNYDSFGRKYVVSKRAHNSVMVDNKDTELIRKNIGKSGLTDYLFEKEISVVAGAHCLYPGIVHQRIVLFLKPWNFYLFDWVKGYKQHRFEQIFNFNPNLQCRESEGKLHAALNGVDVLTITPLLQQAELQTILVKSQRNPLRGWSSMDHGKLEPSWSAGYQSIGTQARFASHLKLQPTEMDESVVSWQADTITIQRKECEWKLILGNQHLHLLRNGQLLGMNPINQPVLKKAIDNWASY